MIQSRTIMLVADNSGAKRVRCIQTLGGRSSLGCIAVVSVIDTIPNSKIKAGTVYKAVIVRLRKETRRQDGTYIKFDNNAVVLINKDMAPVGTRVFGPIPRELRNEGYSKIVSLAQEVI